MQTHIDNKHAHAAIEDGCSSFLTIILQLEEKATICIQHFVLIHSISDLLIDHLEVDEHGWFCVHFHHPIVRLERVIDS